MCATFSPKKVPRIFRLSQIVAVLTLVSACGPRAERSYYPTGELLERAPVDQDGVYEGEVDGFYKNGTVEYRLPFHRHHLNGLVQRYYPTGVLESTEVCQNGETFGQVKQYYPTGRLKYETTRYGKRHVDTARYYHPNGELAQLIVYDAKGRKIDYGVWNRAGRLDPTYTQPIFLSEQDTLREGQDYGFEIRLGNRHSNVVIIKPVVPAARLDSHMGDSGSCARTNINGMAGNMPTASV